MRIRDDVLLGQHSHVGMARTANEDFFGYWEADDDRTFDLKGRLVVVCDGMGGHAGGEIASRLAVKTIIEAYQGDTSDDVMESLRHAIEKANETVYKEGQKPNNTKLKGMGSTMTTLVQRRDLVYFGQVGDSRCYLIRGNAIQQMTKDHSLVQQLVDEGLLDKSEMENHPDKNVILRSLGVKPSVDVDISYVPSAEGDVYLLCSDGLSGLVSEKEMLQIVSAGLKNGSDMRKTAEQLVDLANRYGGHDNITVQLLMVRSTKSGATDSAPKETVTASFTQDEVAASIAKARADAAAKGKVVTPPPPSAAGASNALSAPIPLTQPSMPIPSIEPAKPAGGGGGGGGGGKLFLGLLLGLVIGAGATFGVLKAQGGGGDKGAAQAAQQAATAVQAKGGALKGAGDGLLAQGERALAAGDYGEARVRFEAARAVYEAGAK